MRVVALARLYGSLGDTAFMSNEDARNGKVVGLESGLGVATDIVRLRHDAEFLLCQVRKNFVLLSFGENEPRTHTAYGSFGCLGFRFRYYTSKGDESTN
jgi:hypothetical protein